MLNRQKQHTPGPWFYYMLIRLRPTHTSRRTYAIYPVVSHNVSCHIEGIGR